MKVKELIELLEGLNPENEIDMASDEEGNSYGDISDCWAEGKRLDGKDSYILYPENSFTPEERYIV